MPNLCLEIILKQNENQASTSGKQLEAIYNRFKFQEVADNCLKGTFLNNYFVKVILQ